MLTLSITKISGSAAKKGVIPKLNGEYLNQIWLTDIILQHNKHYPAARGAQQQNRHHHYYFIYYLFN